MPRASSRRSDISEAENDGLAEQELIKLQQDYRVMEGDRKAYSEESQNIIRKQREAIAALQKENEELMKENRLAGSQGNQAKDTKNVDKLSTLMISEDNIQEQTKMVTDTIANMDFEIHQMEKKIVQKRKDMGGTHMSRDRHIALQKQIRVLENRLDQGNKKFNQSLAENTELREDIDHMRTERMIFQGLHKKLEKKLIESKEEIATVIESSTAAYDGRDDAQSKMIALKEKSDKDLLQYNLELKELMRIIDHDHKLKDFMNAKGEDRAEMLGLSTRMSTSRKGDEREKVGDKEDTIESYEVAFEKIKETTDIDDLDLLVGKFIHTEDRNFALFNYVNELNNEIETLHEQIQEVEDNITKFKQESIDTEEARKNILADLEKKHDLLLDEADSYEIQCKAANKVLEQLRLGVYSLFDKVNCDPSPIAEMLGGHTGINNANMMQYLGIIEQRTNEMLQVQAFMSAKDEDKAEVAQAVGLLGKGPQPLPSSINIQPPITGEDYDSDASGHSEDDNRPLTQSELRQRVMRGVSKREGTAARKERNRSAGSASEIGGKEERTGSRWTAKKSPMKER